MTADPGGLPMPGQEAVGAEGAVALPPDTSERAAVIPSVTGTPAQVTPVQVTPVQVTPAPPTPAQPTPAQPTPAQPTPAQPTPAQPTPGRPPPARAMTAAEKFAADRAAEDAALAAERARAAAGPRYQWPLVLVLAGMGLSLAIVAADHFRRGSVLFSGFVLLAFFLRLILSDRDAGWLAVRSRAIDLTCLAVLGVGLTVFAFIVPPPS